MNRLIPKPLFLCAVIPLLASGCHSGKCTSGSPAWRKVTAVARADFHIGDAGLTYADKLHKSLKASNIEHKVVTFSYGWDSNLAQIHRTVVIYRDNTTARHPWWAMDQYLDRPIWLSNETTARQVQFLARRPAIIEGEKYYPSVPDGGKNIRPIEKSEPVKLAKHTSGNAEAKRHEPLTTIQPVTDTPKAKRTNAPSPAAVKAEPRSQSAPPKPALIGKEAPEVSPPKPVAKPDGNAGKVNQPAPLPITPPANPTDPKPNVPKPVPKLRTKPSELDIPKPPDSSRRRGFFEWLFALL